MLKSALAQKRPARTTENAAPVSLSIKQQIACLFAFFWIMAGTRV